MQFSDLTRAVHDAWIFAWPPIVLCAIVFVIARYLSPEVTDEALRQAVIQMREYGRNLDGVRTLLEPYGLTKLVPITCAIIIIGFFYILNGPVTILVSILPPTIVFRPYILFARTSPEQEVLLLTRRYPGAIDVSQAYYFAVNSLNAKSDVGNKDRSTEIGGSRAELWYKTGNFIKFAFLVSLLITIINVRNGLPLVHQMVKLVLIFIVLLVCWMVFLVGYLYQQEQQYHDEWQSLKLMLQDDASNLLLQPVTDEERRNIAFFRREQWWRVDFVDKYRWYWLKQTFFH